MCESEAIQTADLRLKVAKKVYTYLSGKQPGGLLLTTIDGQYYVVDDSNGLWLADKDTYDQTLENLLMDCLEGCWDEQDCACEEDLLANYYGRLCDGIDPIYTSAAPDDDNIEDMLGVIDTCLTVADLRSVLEMLRVDEEPLPAMIIALSHYDDRFHGRHITMAAHDWLDAAFDDQSATQWMEAGFWDHGVAQDLRDAGLSPKDAKEAAWEAQAEMRGERY